jgi:anti-sigma-K factor RskA
VSTALDGFGPGHGVEFEELAAGYALGALDEVDRARFRTHLAACPRCRTLTAELSAAAAILPEALEEMDASPDLRQRILSAARADLPDQVEAPDRLSVVEPRLATPAAARRSRTPRWALPLAALFVVTLGMGYWNYRLQEQLATQAATLQLQQQAIAAIAAGGRSWRLAGTEQAPQAGGLLVQEPNDRRPLLVVHGLPDLPPQQAYQVWVISGGAPTGAGVLEPGSGGQQVTRLDQSLANVDTVALTIEPAGGSRAPTGPIVAAARL